MQIMIVLIVGFPNFDHRTHQATGDRVDFLFRFAATLQEAIRHFKEGDFDAVLLGPSLSLEMKERLTLLIRSTGSRTPVACVEEVVGERNGFADVMVSADSDSIFSTIGGLAKNHRQWTRTQEVMPGVAF